MKNAQELNGKNKKRLGSMALATALLSGFMLFSGASGAKADDWDGRGYDRQVQYTEWRAREAAENFGYYSREARHWRHENHEARERAEHYRRDYWKHRDRYEREHRYRYYDRDRY
jgi:hypothetical protein